MANKNIKMTADGATMYFEHVLPNEVRRGHQSHKSGAGTHGMRKQVRVRGNEAKRKWLDSED